MGPSDGIFRFNDLGVWLAIVFAAMMASLVYGMLFCALGVMWRYGIVLAIPFAAWELGMCLLSMGAPEASILRFSVIGWALMIVDAAAVLAWPNMELFLLQGTSFGNDFGSCLLYTSPSPRDATLSRMPSSA